MKESDVRGMLWLAAMFTGLLLMIPIVWLYNEILSRFALVGLEPTGWIRDILGLAAAMAGPLLAVLLVRGYLDVRYSELKGQSGKIPDRAAPNSSAKRKL